MLCKHYWLRKISLVSRQQFNLFTSTDASDAQLGAAIFPNGQPVAHYTRKLTQAQRNHTTGEKELLSLVATLEEFRTMPYGCPDIRLYTDHHNNTFSNSAHSVCFDGVSSLKNLHPPFIMFEGEDNCLTDALSRSPRIDRIYDDSSPSEAYRKKVSSIKPVRA